MAILKSISCLALLLGIAFLTACSGGDGSAPAPSFAFSQSVSSDDNATQEVVVATSNATLMGTTVTLPAGALTENTMITIDRGNVEETTTGNGLVSQQIKITVNKELAKKVTLRIPITLAEDQSIDDVKVFKLSEGSTTPAEQTISKRNADPTYVEVEQASFSTFWGAIPPPGKWTTMTTVGAPLERHGHTAIWTGSQMVVWGGSNNSSGFLPDGAIWTPDPNGQGGGSWHALATLNAPSARLSHTAIWTGDSMVVWGGNGFGGKKNDGSIWTPGPNGGSWQVLATANAASAREYHTAIWTGDSMVVWGGSNNSVHFGDGAIWTPGPNGGSWQALATLNAPSVRSSHKAIWTGDSMVVWGGGTDSSVYLGDGATWTPGPNGGSWQALATKGAPGARVFHSATWTGDSMVVWGGYSSGFKSDGAIWTPGPNGGSWQAVTTKGAPRARSNHTAIWAGDSMVVWGGGAYGYSAEGAIWIPTSSGGGSWQPTPTANDPRARNYHTAIWTGSKMVVWGGYSLMTASYGGIFDPSGTNTVPHSSNLTSSIESGGLRLNWDAPAGNENYSYRIYYSKKSVLTQQNTTEETTSETTFLLTGLDADTTYHFFVTTVLDGYESQPTAQGSSLSTIPNATNFTAEAGYEKVTLRWDLAEGVDGYRIESVDTSAPIPTFMNVGPSIPIALIDNLTNGQVMHFRIQSFLGSAFSPQSPTLIVTPGLKAPTAMVSGGAESLDVTWAAVDGAVKYIVRYYTQPDKSDLMSVEISGTNHTFNNLMVGTEYTVEVVAVDLNHNESQASTPVSAKALPPAPSGLMAVPGNRSLVVHWQAVLDASAYSLEYADNTEFTNSTEIPLGGTILTHAINAVKNMQEYSLRIKVTVAGLESRQSAAIQATPVLPFPENVMSEQNGANATVTWSAVTNAVNYGVIATPVQGEVFNSGAISSGLVNGLMYQFTTLDTGTTYYFYVFAIDSDNAISEYAEATDISAAFPKPGNVVATAQIGAIKIEWGDVNNATGYNLYHSTSGSVDLQSTKVEDVVSGHTISFAPGQTVYFRVTAKNATEEGALSDLVMATPLPLDAPQNVMASGGELEATVSWGAVNGATGYTLYISLDPAFTTSSGFSVPLQLGDVQDYTYNTTNTPSLIPGDHYFIVIATKGNITSADSSRVMATILAPLAPPMNLMATPGDGQVSLTWDAVNGATSYSVYYDVSASVSSMTSTMVSPAAMTNSAIVSGLTNSTLYHFIVTVTEGTRTSMDSQFVTATPMAAVQSGWASMSATNAPSARTNHTAVWTGSEMIVWGGVDTMFTLSNAGGHYSPSGDSWSATGTGANLPSARKGHTAIFTGSSSTAAINNKMIIWGGDINQGFTNTGSIYDVATKTWTAMSTTGAPEVRSDHQAVWTGSKMIVWGGIGGQFMAINTGGVYDPVTNSWSAVQMSGAPDAPTFFSAVWTGTEMIIWGGYDNFLVSLNSGGRYNPSTNTWASTNTSGAPVARDSHQAVWTGSEMIVWSGNDQTLTRVNSGGRYNPSNNTWNANATNTSGAPTGRFDTIAIWTGTAMVIWGGNDGTQTPASDGGSYNPSNDSWTMTPVTGAPSGRAQHSAVWTGTSIIIWGGVEGMSGPTNTGGVLTP